MTRRRLILLFLPALLIGLLAVALNWLMRSEAGAGWLWERVAAAVPGELAADSLRGDLEGGLRLSGVRYRQPGFELDADRIELQAGLDFFPPALSVHHLRLGRVRMRSQEIAADEPETRVAEWLPRLALPVPVEFRQVAAARLAWDDGSAQAAVAVEDLSFSADWYRRLAFRSLRFTRGASRWQGSVDLGLTPPHALQLSAQGNTMLPGVSAPGQTFMLQARATGSLEASRWSVELQEPAARLSGTLRDLLGEPGWDLQLESPRLPWPPSASAPEFVLHDLLVSSYGSMSDYGVEAEAGLDAGSGTVLRARAVGSGNGDGIDLQILDLAGDAVQVDGTGRIGWDPGFELQASLEVMRIDPRPWFEPWGDAEPARGRLRLQWQQSGLSFEVAEATAPGSIAALSGSGSLDSDSGRVVADLAWEQLAWPPGAAEPAVISERGQARVEGHLDDWRVNGELQLSGPDFPTGRLQVDGGGNRESLSLQVPDGGVLGGSLSGRFELQWAPRVRWSAEAVLADVATAPLLPAFPGRVSGALSASGEPSTDDATPSDLQIEIRQLNGVVRGRTVSANGRLAMDGGRLQARGLRLRSGGSELTADGHLQGADGLSFRADIASLGDLVDGGAGTFTGGGMLSLAAGSPRLRLEGQGRGLAWGSLSAAEIDFATAENGTLSIEAASLRLGDTPIASLTAAASGERPLERFELTLVLEETSARLLIAGGVVDWTAPLASGWRGELVSARVENAGLGYIDLQQPSALRFDTGGLALEAACFQSSREGRMCVDTEWRGNGERLLDASLENVSPSLALQLLGSDLVLSQRLSGEARWRHVPPAEPQAQVRLDVSAGEVSIPGEEEPVLQTRPGLFGFEISEGRLHSGDLDIPLVGSGGADIDFGVLDLAAGPAAPIEGRLRLNLDSIEPLLRLLPGVEGSSGPVTADLQVGGTVADPELTGHLSLVRGRLSHFASGLQLRDIRLGGAVYAYDQTELHGSFRAGDGQGSLRAVVNFGDPLSPELLVELDGENLRLIDVPDLRVQADPDLRLTWREGSLGINGRVFVPSARLSPRFLPTPTASESADVVIVAGEEHLVQTPATAPVQRKISGELELELGDDVRLQLDRATAELRGAAQFRWDGQLVPVADGSFAVTGEIKAYGQLLEVTDGRVNFSGRPADNPILNIRAEREIYGNTQVTRAGVRVTGPLKQPDLEVYTVPMTTRERALTMLVTGSDFNYDQGVGSVEVGMYVAPRLYISYGIGLFDEQNVISARYDLGKGFGIKTTSGQRETGADISYTIER